MKDSAATQFAGCTKASNIRWPDALRPGEQNEPPHSVTDHNLKAFENAGTNTNAAFDYGRELLGVKSLSEFIQLSSARARKQFETMTAQIKELTTLAQKASIGTARAFNKVA